MEEFQRISCLPLYFQNCLLIKKRFIKNDQVKTMGELIYTAAHRLFKSPCVVV